ncbi:MAG: phosphotransferase family protein [Gordonia sp.]|nr:phosphotransferase family protein [Gordonia sp. (in: high G+C Gram-positive bacteria)]
MVPGLIDDKLMAEIWDRVDIRCRAWHSGSRVIDIQPMAGGSSSLTFLLRLDGVEDRNSRIVLKVAPPGLAPVRNRDVLRQARLQRALQSTERLLAPPVLFDDPGEPPFMAMVLIPGQCTEPVLAIPEDRPSAALTKARYLDAAALLAHLHSVAPAEVGLGDEPVTTLGDEIDRWTRAFATVPAELSGRFLEAASALHATIPAALPPVVNHGDYRLGNTLCELDRVSTIIDWEIWTIGDPRVDVAWFTFFTDDASHPAADPVGPAGTPSKAEVVTAYEAVTGHSMPNMVWFDALTKYKEAAATALILKRAMKNSQEMSLQTERMLPHLPELVQQTLDLVGV